MLKHIVFAVLLGISFLSLSQPSEVVKAKLAYEEQDFLEAKDHIEKAILHDKTVKKSSTWVLRGDIYQQIIFHSDQAIKNSVQNASRLAFESYQKALSIDKKMSRSKINSKCEFINNLALNNGVQHFNDRDYRRAKSEFVLCVEVAEWLGKTDSLALFNIGMACERLKDYDCAINSFKQCAELNYMRESSYESLGYCHQLKGDYEGAISILREALELYPNNNTFQTALLNVFLLTGENEKALELTNQLIEEYPEYAIYYSVKGSTLSNLNRPDEAIIAFEKGLSIDPESFDMNYNLGSIYFNKGADILIAANNEDDETKTDERSGGAAALFEKAKIHFEKAHSIKPDDLGTMDGLKTIYAYTYDMEKLDEIEKKMSGY